MNNRTLGIIAMAGAPFLLIDTITGGFNPYSHSSLTGLFGLIYMAGWMCSLVALKRSGAYGEGKWSKIIYTLQMVLLVLANGWNTYELVQPGADTTLYYILDACWPLSNTCMLITGITIARKGVLQGWKRYMPLLVGLWLPIGFLLWALFGSRTTAMLLWVNIYSAVTWALMGYSVFTSPVRKNSKPYTTKKEQLAVTGL